MHKRPTCLAHHLCVFLSITYKNKTVIYVTWQRPANESKQNIKTKHKNKGSVWHKNLNKAVHTFAIICSAAAVTFHIKIKILLADRQFHRNTNLAFSPVCSEHSPSGQLNTSQQTPHRSPPSPLRRASRVYVSWAESRRLCIHFVPFNQLPHRSLASSSI